MSPNYPIIDPVAFELFGIPVRWYGLLIAFGAVLGFLIASSREKKYSVKKDTVLDFLLIALPVALVCARLYYVAFSWDDYAHNPIEILHIRSGGMAIYGGIIGAVIVGIFFCRRKKVSFWTLADLCAPALVLAQGIGRWGNFINQEAYGALVENPAMQFFPLSVYVYVPAIQSYEWHYATFFYESAWCILTAAALLLCERRNVFRRRGDVFIWYGLAYCAERVVVEGMRTDSLYMGDIRISQLISAVMLIFCAAVFLRRVFKQGEKPVLLTVLLSVLSLAVPLSLAYLPTPYQAVHALVLLVLGAFIYRKTKVESCDSNA